MARYDDLNTKGIAYAAVLSIVILIVVLQGTQALCYYMINSADALKEMKKSDSARDEKSEQLAAVAARPRGPPRFLSAAVPVQIGRAHV